MSSLNNGTKFSSPSHSDLVDQDLRDESYRSLMTIEEVAEATRRSYNAVWQDIQASRLPASKPKGSRRWLIRRMDVAAYVLYDRNS